MALERETHVLGRHAGAVIGDRDQAAAAIADRNIHLSRPRIDRVLHQLLDDGAGALDHFAGGDAVDRRLRQAADTGSRGAGGRGIGHRRACSRRYSRASTLPSSTAG